MGWDLVGCIREVAAWGMYGIVSLKLELVGCNNDSEVSALQSDHYTDQGSSVMLYSY